MTAWASWACEGCAIIIPLLPRPLTQTHGAKSLKIKQLNSINWENPTSTNPLTTEKTKYVCPAPWACVLEILFRAQLIPSGLGLRAPWGGGDSPPNPPRPSRRYRHGVCGQDSKGNSTSPRRDPGSGVLPPHPVLQKGKLRPQAHPAGEVQRLKEGVRPGWTRAPWVCVPSGRMAVLVQPRVLSSRWNPFQLGTLWPSLGEEQAWASVAKLPLEAGVQFRFCFAL